jgi:Zn-dependent M28 family amino/carboxypeptidase
VSFKAHIVSQVHRFTASNIIGVIPGSDPQLSKEAVIYTAHWDHLGIIPEMPGDNIYNGAEDNATGSASLIEIARAFQMSPERPKRTILLIADAAEEQGMIGVEHFSQHPTIPAEKIALDLNYDGQAPLGDATQVRIGGAEQTNFLPEAESIAKKFNMSVAPAAGAGSGCCRSDTFWLNSVGIPTLSMGPSQFANHTAEWMKEYSHDFRETHYHQPSDEYHEDWDFTGNARVARYGFAIGWQAAMEPEMIDWKPSAEYEPARQKHMFCAPDHLCP